jgi:Na+-transporting NADH:ubiquinone oxidoreductase subunit NqrE
MTLRIVLFLIAAALAGAHFLRAGSYSMVALCLATPLLFLFRRRWSLMLLQLAAYGATLNWMLAIVLLVQMRQQIGRPWATAALILGVVTLLTLLAGLLLNSRSLRERYP